jgi:hypothetical protein
MRMLSQKLTIIGVKARSPELSSAVFPARRSQEDSASLEGTAWAEPWGVPS